MRMLVSGVCCNQAVRDDAFEFFFVMNVEMGNVILPSVKTTSDVCMVD